MSERPAKIWVVEEHDGFVIRNYDLFWEKQAADAHAAKVAETTPDHVDVYEVEVR